jgi:hypothetical protein
MSLRKEGVRASAPRRTPMHSTTRRQSMYCPGQGPGELRARPAPRAGRASCHACAAQGGPSGLRRRPWSVVPGEARHAQRLLLVIVGIVRLTYANASAGVDRDRCRPILLPRICHARMRHRSSSGSPCRSSDRCFPVLASVEDAENVHHELAGRLVDLIGDEGPVLEGGRPHSRSDVVTRSAGIRERGNGLDVVEDR